MQDLKVALIQTPLFWEDREANRKMFENRFDAINKNTDLVILPEMFTTGFSMDPHSNAETMQGNTVSWLQKNARQFNFALCGSVIIEEKGNYYNRLFFVFPDGDFQHYDKRHRFTMGGEHKSYSAGDQLLVVDFNGWKIQPFVCYDLRFPVWMRNTKGCDLQIVVANWPAVRADQWNRLLPARAIENQCYVAAVNRIGTDGNEVDHSGNSGVFDFLGNRIAYAGSNDAIIHQNLSHSALLRFRKKFPVLKDADKFTILPD